MAIKTSPKVVFLEEMEEETEKIMITQIHVENSH